MPIETDFKFAHRAAPNTLTAHDLLGNLRGFVGHHDSRTWKGHGFNMLWRPNHGQSGTQDFFLELNMTKEEIDFRDITGTGVANRGFHNKDIFLGAIAYIQQVSDKTGPQHFEPGVWINIEATDDPKEPLSVARMGSIPHGTTINLQGVSIVAGAVPPKLDVASITPFKIGSPDDGVTGLHGFPEQKNVQTPMPSRTDPVHVPGLDDPHLNDPNQFLHDANKGLTFLSNTVLILTSKLNDPLSPVSSRPPAPAPDTGGGTDDIAFLDGTASGPNAFVDRVTTTFWIERVRDATGHEFDQLQYTQRVLLNFNGLSWPHVSVATLR